MTVSWAQVKAPLPQHSLALVHAWPSSLQIALHAPSAHLPSSPSTVQLVPSGAFGFEHLPVLESHVPATWHWSAAAQTTGFPPLHLPL
jgi:hypothetical protein